MALHPFLTIPISCTDTQMTGEGNLSIHTAPQALSTFAPLIADLEQLARTHLNPTKRANLMHLIDVMRGCNDPDMLDLMHTFYTAREQLRQERQS